jgi:hypothetical protein
VAACVTVSWPEKKGFPRLSPDLGILRALMPWRQLFDNARDFMRGMAYGRYEQQLRQESAELSDLFVTLCYLELVGLPNPVAVHLLEIYPYFLDQFHAWHRRMGFKHSPLEDFRCC